MNLKAGSSRLARGAKPQRSRKPASDRRVYAPLVISRIHRPEELDLTAALAAIAALLREPSPPRGEADGGPDLPLAP